MTPDQNLERFNAAHDLEAEQRLFHHAMGVSTAQKKLFWLQKSADVVGLTAQKSHASPCAPSCSHCCHIALAITDSEALALARASGRKYTPPASAVYVGEDTSRLEELTQTQAKAHYGKPCPFLRDSVCSVYSARPLACRYQISLANNADPCVIGNTSTEVPFLNTMDRKLRAILVLLGPGRCIADIRDWFPSGDGA